MSIHDDNLKAEWLVQQFAARQIDRRQLLGGMLALAGTTLAQSVLSNPAFAQTPKKGGHFRFAMGHGEAADSFDPAFVNNGFTTVIAYSVTNMLTEIDAGGNLLPKLAESWEASDGARKWVFRLRKGVEFHDGRSFGAKDVVASINHHRGEESKSTAKPMVANIADVKAEDDHTVAVTLSAGDADLPYTFSTFNFGMYPARDDGTIDWQAQVGTGAYRLKELQPGIKASFERNPNFWQADRAFFDSAELLSVVDVAARQNALMAGDVDGIDRVELRSVERLKSRAGIVVEEVEGKVHYTFPMRTDTDPFTNNHVRLALKHALDREALLNTILFGHGTIGNDHPISAAYRYHAADLEQRTYDPDKAKFHLKEAGLDALKLDLSAAGAAYAGAVDAATLFREQALKAGIDINIVREPDDGYWGKVWMVKPFCTSYWFGTPTEDGIFSQAFSKGAAWNDTFWDNDRFNQLLVAARAELDEAKRRTMYHDMQRLTRDEGGAIIPLFANDVFATSDRVRHGKLANNYEVDGRLMLERWWFA